MSAMGLQPDVCLSKPNDRFWPIPVCRRLSWPFSNVRATWLKLLSAGPWLVPTLPHFAWTLVVETLWARTRKALRMPVKACLARADVKAARHARKPTQQETFALWIRTFSLPVQWAAAGRIAFGLPRNPAAPFQALSKRSRFITFVHAATKSSTNFFPALAVA